MPHFLIIHLATSMIVKCTISREVCACSIQPLQTVYLDQPDLFILQDPEGCTSSSLLHCKLATSTNIAETVGAASESACRQDDYISSQTHYNFRAVKPACLKENCLMAVNCKPTDRASLMDVSNYGQKKCRRTASCQVPNPEMDGWEIGGLVLEKSCLKYAEGCSGSVSKSSRQVCS